MDKFIKSMIEDMYETQGAVAVHEIENTRFSANISVANLQMLDAIARYFSRSRSDLVEEILNHSVLSMFMALEQSEKDSLSKECDEQFLNHMKKSFKDNGGSYESAGLGYWTSFAHAFAEKERNDANS